VKWGEIKKKISSHSPFRALGRNHIASTPLSGLRASISNLETWNENEHKGRSFVALANFRYRYLQVSGVELGIFEAMPWQS
jgi:hypothetical protein